MRKFAVSVMLFAGLVLAFSAAAQLLPEAQQPAARAESSQPLSQQQQMGLWIGKAAQAWQDKDTENWVAATEKLHELRPFNQDFMRHLVEGNAELGHLDKAFEMMLSMQQQGLTVDWDSIDAVEPLREHRLYDYLNDLMTQAGQPFGNAETWSTLPAEHAMPEALALDAGSGRMFAGTVQQGLILVSDDDGKSWKRFASPETVDGLTSVFGMAVDAERDHLWVATGKVGQFQGKKEDDAANSALLRLDLKSGKLQKSYPVSVGSGRNLLGSLVVTADGRVFAADTQSPVIYRLDPDADEVALYFGHPNLTSLRGMALNADDSLLYVSDYELGIMVIDATGGQQAWQLAIPDELNAGGIDGLFWWDNHLVVIQNAIAPQRLMRLTLGRDGLGVTSIAPLAAALEEFDTPTFGVMDGPDLYFLAASHWQHVDGKGKPVDDLPDVPIMKVDVSEARDQPASEELLERARQSQAASAAAEKEGGQD